MKRLLFFSLLLLVGCNMPAPTVPISTPRPSSTLGLSQVRVASWNVRNLFDAVDDKYKDDVPTRAQHKQKLADLKQVIEALEADFLALQEVENLEVLQELNQTLNRPYPHVGLIEGNDRIRGIDVAFLSRLPVKRVTSHKSHDLPDLHGISKNHPFSRDCLEVAIDSEPPLIFLVNHLKSQKGNNIKKSATKRRAQSEGVVEIAGEIAALEPGVALVVLGDLNDRPDSWAVEPLFQAFEDPFAKLPKKQRITHRFKKGGSALDHILLNPAAAKLASGPNVWQKIARDTSDHSPVSVELELRLLSKPLVKEWAKSE